MEHDVFISYSTKNKEAAQAICHVLEQNEIRCWMAPRNVPPGSDYGDVIEDAIQSCKSVIVLFSEAAAQSQFVKSEINIAFEEQKTIIPFRLDETPLKGQNRLMLNKTHWIDAYPDYKTKFSDLVAAVALSLGKKTSKKQDIKILWIKDILPRITKRLVMPAILAVVVIACVAVWMKWSNERDLFGKCRTQSDYEQLSANAFFFTGQCQDSLQMFSSLKTPYAQVNDSENTERDDAIKVKWNEECSLQQLRVLRGIINNMMLIEKGIFMMGASEPLGLEEKPHEVTIDRNYYIGKFEVTEREWNVVMKDSLIGDAKMPMTNVSWNDCQLFVRKLQSLTGLIFTLPTEAEWEYAARKNDDDCKYAGSDNPEDVATFDANAEEAPTTIGEHAPNALELYDMSGNVSEWCNDGSDRKKIIRGGSFMSGKEEITVTYADAAAVETRSKTIGLRLVLIP